MRSPAYTVDMRRRDHGGEPVSPYGIAFGRTLRSPFIPAARTAVTLSATPLNVHCMELLLSLAGFVYEWPYDTRHLV